MTASSKPSEVRWLFGLDGLRVITKSGTLAIQLGQRDAGT